jgi:putative transposase
MRCVSVETFNLAAPPGFRGLDPYTPINAYHRHLPHWRQGGATYFVTFRLGDALPQEKLSFLKRLRDDWEQTHPAPRSAEDWEILARDLFRYEDAWLDEGCGACYFRNPKLAAHLEEALLHFQNERYHVSCWVVMPNHCHMVMRPFDDWKLETILQGVKGVVAHRINASLGVVGSLWQDESYDRIVRDEEHLWRVVQYVGRNPARACLSRNTWRRWVDPSWESAGWKFSDS